MLINTHIINLLVKHFTPRFISNHLFDCNSPGTHSFEITVAVRTPTENYVRSYIRIFAFFLRNYVEIEKLLLKRSQRYWIAGSSTRKISTRQFYTENHAAIRKNGIFFVVRDDFSGSSTLRYNLPFGRDFPLCKTHVRSVAPQSAVISRVRVRLENAAVSRVYVGLGRTRAETLLVDRSQCGDGTLSHCAAATWTGEKKNKNLNNGDGQRYDRNYITRQFECFRENIQ